MATLHHLRCILTPGLSRQIKPSASLAPPYTLGILQIFSHPTKPSASCQTSYTLHPSNYPMAPSPRAQTPFTLAKPAVFSALAAVGAVPADHPRVNAFNPFAQNDTPYRNIILIGQDADAEWRYLHGNPHFDPYTFATTTIVLDCQRLYDWLNPHENLKSLLDLILYCFPETDISCQYLHNAANDAYWELQVCLHLLKELATRLAPESIDGPVFPKLWDAIFVCVDVEALNGRKTDLTELGFACLDSRHINNIHH